VLTVRETAASPFCPLSQPAKAAPFAGGNEGTFRKTAAGQWQPAKAAPFAGGNEGTFRKTAAGQFFPF
jgi:hypothetical protein